VRSGGGGGGPARLGEDEEGLLPGEAPRAPRGARPSHGVLRLQQCRGGRPLCGGTTGIERVAIVDWDVHHGNGTQHAFCDNPRVFYISLHQYPAYPGTGRSSEKGEGKGLGTTANFPLPPGTSQEEYESLFDPLADLRLSSDSFGRLTSLLSGVAGLYAEDRIVSVLEGGYNLKALSESVGFHLSALVLQRKEMDSKKVSYLPTCRSGCTRKSADADGWRHEVIFGRY